MTDLMAHYSRPRPPEWYAEQERLFLDAIRPLTELQVLVYSAYLPTIILDAEGKVMGIIYLTHTGIKGIT